MKAKAPHHVCPVCGYPRLAEPPRGASGGGSYEICPSCGFQFGVDDDDKGISFAQWRAEWLAKGAPWSSQGIARPQTWNGRKQAASLDPKPAKKKTDAPRAAKR